VAVRRPVLNRCQLAVVDLFAQSWAALRQAVADVKDEESR
jgi:hypothetical protein